MRKILLSFLSAFLMLTVSVGKGFANNSTEWESMEDVVEVLSKVEGYVFITYGESRDLRNTFTRTDVVFEGVQDKDELAVMSWYVYDTSVATVPYNDGVIKAMDYGNTLLKITETDGTNHYFIVFVTPTITVVSPEGSIYTHQKIFDEKARLKLSQSNEYVINCVMRDGFDITERVVMHDNTSEDGMGFGEYISTDDIREDVTLTLTLKQRDGYEDLGYRLRVDGMTISLVDQKGNPEGFGGKLKATIKSVNGQVVYNEKFPSDGVLKFNDDVVGVYFLSFDMMPELGTYKFITRHN